MKEILICTYPEFFKDKLFDIYNPSWNYDNRFLPFFMLREELRKYGYELRTIDLGNPVTAEFIIFSDIHQQNSIQFKYFKKCIEDGFADKMILLLLESPIVLPQSWDKNLHKYFRFIFTWNDDLVDQEKYIKINYPQPFPQKLTPPLTFNNKKLITLINGNKIYKHPLELYSERIHAIYAFERLCPYEFDLYGTGWNQPRSAVERNYPFLIPKFKSYKGSVISKDEVLSKYKFAICYENMLGAQGLSGYITEKLHHCFMSSCIPIYLGANNIEKYIPRATFIDRRNFDTYDQLFCFISSINEVQYQNYINNIIKYLQSDKFYQDFSVEIFTKIIINKLLINT